ncbi:protein SENSITIVITY TO RED LIGHT REDUCED 1 [Carica papaya]|uniref:protein SENSITIVITY TO RED LIGHT REDUCED 1 n=1 Tax=Carica papaya TaxID=3649 RepID=UPI000B8CA775|nr:protein SENSITIVITY TO RED LIGHT REDUCED 1 [Carica papaya]XP_021901676.1 protein SENSITIVITY TO RED LIGHT REDUCED 1 [Carica papaya]XP_021901677.1 protein SENSITIVITY TO RED LIGHT REDUCED 1 [Carica papaya]XP_021901678.1 protein SENSITIVITY TO RED LIGHT REDUCED 1 [Carica papaya]
MAASAKVLTIDNLTQNGEWTIVLPRRQKQRRTNSIKTRTEEGQPWIPTDLETDPRKQSKLMQKMETSMRRIENSQFYASFLEQIQSSDMLDRFHKVLGSDLKMQMVIYGIGSIESYEPPRFQLSLAILMKRKFSWIGDIEVFDPVLSATESWVLEALGCTVLSVNEEGRRQALKPTLFFMPHCEAELYNNLLQANWRVDLLNRIVLFGNSFETYEQNIVYYRNSSIINSARHVIAVRKFSDEFRIKTISDDYFAAFLDSSWHFFGPDLESELPSINYDGDYLLDG